MAAAKSLTHAELEHALAHISNTTFAQRDRAMLLVMVLAGLRVSEVANLKLNDVCDANGTIRAEIYLSANRVKHGHARTVYVSTRLQEELDAYVLSRKWYEDTQPLFTTYSSPRKAFTPNVLSQHFIGCSKLLASKAQAATVDARRFLPHLLRRG